MKFIKLISIFVFLTSGTMIGQKAEPIILRFTIQQQFIINKFLSNGKHLSINDTIQMDSLFSSVNKYWKLFVKDSLSIQKTNLSIQALNNLDAYSYSMRLSSTCLKIICYHLLLMIINLLKRTPH